MLVRSLSLLSRITVVLTAALPISCKVVEEVRVAQFPHESLRAVSIDTRNGSIEVIQDATRSDVEIQATIRAADEFRLSETRVVASREDDGTLKIGVKWPDGDRQSREGCSFAIKIPDAQGITANTGNGGIRIQGLEGQANLDTSNGRVHVSAHRGDVRVTTSNGALELDEVLGSVIAKTSNGSIRIVLAEGSEGPFQVNSSNGSGSVELPASFQGKVRASTSNGSISVVGAERTTTIVSKRREHEMIVGKDTGKESWVTTSNGSITITVAGGSSKGRPVQDDLYR